MRRGERALPAEHAAVNLALYRRGRPFAWVMTEHEGGSFDDDAITIAGTRLSRDGAGWRIDLVDRSAPLGRRVEGTIRIEPLAGPAAELVLSSDSAPARHAWRVMAPRARVRADMRHPTFTLDAIGYHDRNHGEGRLEDTFSRWGWARFHGRAGTTVLYALTERDGRRRAFALRAPDGDQGAAPVTLTDPIDHDHAGVRLGWGLRGPARFGVDALACELGAPFEQAPFYARFFGRLTGCEAAGDERGMGEWLDLDRFRSRVIQTMLRFKMRFE